MGRSLPQLRHRCLQLLLGGWLELVLGWPVMPRLLWLPCWLRRRWWQGQQQSGMVRQLRCWVGSIHRHFWQQREQAGAGNEVERVYT